MHVHDALYYTIKEVSAQPVALAGGWTSRVMAQSLFRLFTIKRAAYRGSQVALELPFLHVQRGCGYTCIHNSTLLTRAPRVTLYNKKLLECS